MQHRQKFFTRHVIPRSSLTQEGWPKHFKISSESDRLSHLKRLTPTQLMITIERHHLDYHSGQHEFALKAIYEGEYSGRLLYCTHNDEVLVKMIEVPEHKRRRGIGTSLVVALQEHYPDTAIDFGSLTEDGTSLLASLEWELKVNETHVAAAWELAELETKLDAYTSKFENLSSCASDKEREVVIAEVADWNDLHDRADGLRKIVDNEPSIFRFVKGPKIDQPPSAVVLCP